MVLRVDDFKARLVDGGARANLYKATVNFPSAITDGKLIEDLSFLCKGTSLPGSTVGSIDVSFRGRVVHFAGDREYETWSVTVINDNSMNIRNAFERWVDIINTARTNVGATSPNAYQVDMEVAQLDKGGRETKKYIIRNAWPTNIAAIDLSYDSQNEIEEFTVEFQMDYWEDGGTSLGDAAQQLVDGLAQGIGT